jgi:hypothetical protein
VFCIVSSDSDYAPLAMRIREEVFIVIGYRKGKTFKETLLKVPVCYELFKRKI